MGITKILAILIGVVITIITLAFVGGYISSVFSGTKVAQGASELSTVIANVQGLYASQPSFLGLNNTAAIQGGVYPSNMATQTSTQAIDPWGHQAIVDIDSNTTSEFTVEFNGIPQAACTKMATSYQSSNLVSLSIGGNDVSAMDPATLASACATATSSGPTNMIWTLN
ncbi:MAG: type 4 pilus major pilin [bacterium]